MTEFFLSLRFIYTLERSTVSKVSVVWRKSEKRRKVRKEEGLDKDEDLFEIFGRVYRCR